MNKKLKRFMEDIVSVVDVNNFLHKQDDIASYCQGIRVGKGPAFGVVIPDSLLKFWKILNICISYKMAIIIQAANTGLTGGSTPYGDDYDRELIIVSTLKIDSLILLNGGSQVIAFPGTTLYKLEESLAPLRRGPHSVIGSSCIGASVIGGICNNSGGNLVNRGPAYTELSLYVRLTSDMKLDLVNHLGIDLGEKPEEIITNLENINFNKNNIPETSSLASDTEYKKRVREINSPTPARFNADKRRLYESSGCAGKLAVFAVRLDTFKKPSDEKVFFVGTNNPSNFTEIRKKILTDCTTLPDMGEYMHKSYFDGSDNYCKDSFAFIKYFGTAFIPRLLSIKRKFDYLSKKTTLRQYVSSDRILQCLSGFLPDHLPKRVRDYRERFDHYLLILASDQSIPEVESILSMRTDQKEDLDFFICNESEGQDVLLHRYVAGSAPMRFSLINAKSSGQLLPLDVALPRNFDSWHNIFPVEITDQFEEFFQMGHFLCMVFHWDIVLKKGVDASKIKKQILSILDNYGAKYPAEHNVGHIYEAEETLLKFYQELDPTNSFNPGVGKTSKKINYM